MSDYTPANYTNPYNNLNLQHLSDNDISLGLGGEDIDWRNSPSLSKEQDNNSAIYDGYGNFTTPYSTADRYIDRRHISMHAYFYTQRDEYDAYYVVGKKDNPQATIERNQHEFSQELMGFHTDNQNKGIPTMQIYLFGYRSWEQILKPNDYVALRVWETYPDIPSEVNGNSEDQRLHPRDTQGIRKRTLMVGLISQIQINIDGTSNGYTYVITCQGMQKVLADINLGLPKTAQWNDVNLLYDINGESSPYNEQFPTYSKGGSSDSGKSSSSGGKTAYGLSGVPGQIAEYFSSKGCNKKQVAAILGNAQDESQFKNVDVPGQALGYFSFNHNPSIGSARGSVDSQCLAISHNGIGLNAWKSQTSNSSVSSAAALWGSKIEGGVSGQRIEYAENWYNKMH